MSNISAFISKGKKSAVFPIVGADHCAHLLNINFSEVAYSGRKLAKVIESGYDLYRYDMVLVFSDPYVEAQAMGCQLEFTPYPTLVTTRTDKKIDRTPVIIEAANIIKKKIKVPIFISIKGPFSLASFLAGVNNFLRMLVKEETKARRLIKAALDFQIKYLESLLSLGVNIFIGDPVASASVISPEMFKNYAFAPLQILVKKVKENSLLAGIHICGDTRPLIGQLDSLNADILSVEDISPITKTLKMGGVSTQTILCGTKAKIRQEVKKARLQEPLIIATACDVPPQTPKENIKEMIHYARK